MAKNEDDKNTAKDKQKTLKTLKWPVPGTATATLYFSDAPDGFKGIFVALMPNFFSDAQVGALIGDTVKEDDLMDIDHFEQVWPKLGVDGYFIRARFVNRSEKKVKFDLGFDFDGDDKPEQRYSFEIKKNGRLKATIPVKLK